MVSQKEREEGDELDGVVRLPRKRMRGWRCWRRVLVAFMVMVIGVVVG